MNHESSSQLRSNMKKVLCFMAAAFPFSVAGVAHAQDFPTKPVRLVVPYGPGGPTDMVARELGHSLEKILGQPVIIDNKSGGGSIIGVGHVAKSPGDGYTLVFATGAPFIMNPYLNSKLPYEVKDFAPVSKVASYTMVLSTGAKQPFKTLKEMVTYAKANPGTLTYASAGPGTSNHLAGELLQNLTGAKLTHVPYRGNGPAMTDVIAGNVSMMFDMPATTLPHVRNGRVQLLGSTSKTRSAQVPELPTIAEQGVTGFDVTSWFGVLAPKSTPEKIVNQLNEAIRTALNSDELKQKLKAVGYEVTPSTPRELEETIASEGKVWSEVIKKANIRLE